MTGGAGCDVNQTGLRCPGQTVTEYNTEMSLWCMAAAPLIVAVDIRNMSDTMSASLLNKELVSQVSDWHSSSIACNRNSCSLSQIAIDQDPLGIAGTEYHELYPTLTRCYSAWCFSDRLYHRHAYCQVSHVIACVLYACHDYSIPRCIHLVVLVLSTGGLVGNWNCSAGAAHCQIWARPLVDDPTQPGVARFAAALYNSADDGPHNITMRWSVIPNAGWGDNTPVQVRDVWWVFDCATCSYLLCAY